MLLKIHGDSKEVNDLTFSDDYDSRLTVTFFGCHSLRHACMAEAFPVTWRPQSLHPIKAVFLVTVFFFQSTPKFLFPNLPDSNGNL